tara:strand:- start:87 stop:368 length:282 start_codon:yes stop_codon:yes gene_type:complete
VLQTNSDRSEEERADTNGKTLPLLKSSICRRKHAAQGHFFDAGAEQRDLEETKNRLVQQAPVMVEQEVNLTIEARQENGWFSHEDDRFARRHP